MSCLDTCLFQEILNSKVCAKVTSFSFNVVSFVRNTPPIISLLYKKLIKCISKANLLKVLINQRQPIKSVEELDL